MTLGEKITKQRKELNYTQEQLADILGVSRQSISKWESDIAYPETDKLIELGKLFDCSMDYLLKEDVTEKSDVQASGFTEKVEEISRKVMTDKNKGKAKKILKIIGIILAVVLVIDIKRNGDQQDFLFTHIHPSLKFTILAFTFFAYCMV